MFKVPTSLLTDTVTVSTITYTGLGETLDTGATIKCRVTTGSKWISNPDGALIQDITTIVSYDPLIVGSSITLADDTTIEVKSCKDIRYGTRIMCYESVAW